MQRGVHWLDGAKILVGIGLIAVGSWLIFRPQSPAKVTGFGATIAHAQLGSGSNNTYTASWQATKLLAIDTTNLGFVFSNTNNQKEIAIGPAEWQVTYKDSSNNTIATETWNIPNPPFCFNGAGTQCSPSGANAQQYLYGLVAPSSGAGQNATFFNNPVNPNYFKIVSTTDAGLYVTTGINNRFWGSGAAGLTNNNSNIEGFRASGGYGWVAGAFNGDAHNGGNDYVEAAGIMMPLQWNVSGTIYTIY